MSPRDRRRYPALLPAGARRGAVHPCPFKAAIVLLTRVLALEPARAGATSTAAPQDWSRSRARSAPSRRHIAPPRRRRAPGAASARRATSRGRRSSWPGTTPSSSPGRRWRPTAAAAPGARGYRSRATRRRLRRAGREPAAIQAADARAPGPHRAPVAVSCRPGGPGAVGRQGQDGGAPKSISRAMRALVSRICRSIACRAAGGSRRARTASRRTCSSCDRRMCSPTWRCA